MPHVQGYLPERALCQVLAVPSYLLITKVGVLADGFCCCLITAQILVHVAVSGKVGNRKLRPPEGVSALTFAHP